MITVQPRPVLLGGVSLARTPLSDAILRTLAYADVFDYPLTINQIWRYLIGVSAGLPQVQAEIDTGLMPSGWIEYSDGFYSLPGRRDLFSVRRRRSLQAKSLWPRALRYGRWLSRLPFVRMVAVTGALAMDNEPGRDLDFLVVTAPGRLWFCRGLAMLLVRLARRFGDELCPNYIISTRALQFSADNLYTAHELVQMIPLCGFTVYNEMRNVNRWTSKYLPNAYSRHLAGMDPAGMGEAENALRSFAEFFLSTSFGEKLEAWEQRRKIAMLQKQSRPGSEVAFDAERCKGHFGGYGGRSLTAYQQRLALMGLADG